MGFKLADVFIPIIGDDSQIKETIDNLKAEGQRFGQSFGSTIKTAATGAIIGGAALATTAIVGMGVAALDVSGDAKVATDRIVAQYGLQEQKAQEINESIKSIYANNFGESVEDVGESLGQTIEQMERLGEVSQEVLEAATTDALALRDAYGVEVAESTSAMTTLMDEFNLTQQQASDFITKGMQSGLNASGDFLESIGEYSNLFSENGFAAEQFFSILETGQAGGVLGTDKIADAFKENGIIMREVSDDLLDSLRDMGVDYNALFEGMEDGTITVADAMSEILPALNAMENPIHKNTAGTRIFGTMWEDLGASAFEALDLTATSLADMEGATDSLNRQYENWPSMWEGIKRQTATALTPLTDNLLVMGSDLMPVVMEHFNRLMTEAGPIIEDIALKFGEWVTAFIAGETGLNQFLNTVIPFIQEHGPMLLSVITGIVGGFGLFSIISTVAGWIAGLIGFVSGLTATFTAAGGGITALVAILGGPLTVAIAAISGLVALFAVAWRNDWGGIRDHTTNIINFLRRFILDFVTRVAAWWAEHGEEIMATAQAAWEYISGKIEEVLGIIETLWQAWQATREGDWYEFGVKLREAWDEAWDLIVTTVKEVWPKIKEALTNVKNSLFDWWSNIEWKQLGETAGKTIVDALLKFLEDNWQRVKDLIGNMVEGVTDIWDGLTGGGQSGAQSVRNTNSFTNATNALGDSLRGGGLVPITPGGTPIPTRSEGDHIELHFDFSGSVISSRGQLQTWVDEAIQAALQRLGRRTDRLGRLS